MDAALRELLADRAKMTRPDVRRVPKEVVSRYLVLGEVLRE
jgi:hypothetical protein